MGTKAEYKYLFVDLLTNQVNAELPCYGVSFSRQLNGPTEFTVSVNLDRTGFTNKDMLEATTPAKTAFFIDRDGRLIFGGILWSRTYQSQAKSLSFTGQTFESYPYKIGIEESYRYNRRDQRMILGDLFLYMQQKLNADIGIQPDPKFGFYDESTNVLRTTDFFVYDQWTYGRAIEYLLEYDDGLDYTIEVAYDDSGAPMKQIKCDQKLGAKYEATGLVLEYPGNILNYYYPESCGNAVVQVLGAGAGDGVQKLRTVGTNTDLLDAGYPAYQAIYSNQDVSVMSTLQTQTQREAVRLHIPIIVPTIELDPGKFPSVGDFGLGDYAELSIQDSRFSDGLKMSVRILGWEATPPSSDGPEEFKLILEGQQE